MAGYDYNYRSGYSNGKGGGPFTNGWNKTSYTDGECRTIIVDADGTLRTIIGCDPFQKPGTYVTKRVLSPAKEYGYADDWRRPPSPPKNYGYTVGDQYPRRPSSPPKSYAVGRPSSPPKSYAVGRRPSPPKSYAVGRPSSPPKSYAVGRPSSPPKSYAVGMRSSHILDPYGTQRTVIPQIFRDDEYREVIVDPDGGERTVIGHTFREPDNEIYYRRQI